MSNLSHKIAGFLAATALTLTSATVTAATDSSEAADIPVSSVSTHHRQMKSGSFLSGRFARTIGDFDTARRNLEDLLQDDPENYILRGQLLIMALAQGDMKTAGEHAEILKEAEEHEPIVDLVVAVNSVYRGDLDKAETYFSKVFSGAGANLWQPLFIAWLDVGRGELKKPIQLNDIVETDQELPSFLIYHVALINDAAGFTDVAERQYEQAVMDHSTTPFRAVEAAADFFRRQDKNERLAKLKLDFMSAHPTVSVLVDSDTASQMAALMTQDPDSHRSERLVNNAFEGVAEVLFTMASVLYTVDAGQDTQLYLRMSLYLRPDFQLARLLLANVLEDLNRPGEASKVYASIGKQSPLSERALLRHAYMVERQGRLDEALALLKQRAYDYPDDYDAYVAMGDLLRNRAMYDDAADAYSKALSRIQDVTPQHWAVFFSRGACLERLGDWDEAREDLKIALELNPEHPEIMNYLGYGMLTHGGDVKAARELIEKAYALMPGAPHILDSLGWVYYKSGDVKEAVTILEQAIELTPGDATVNDHLGDAYWQVGRRNEARFQWNRALTFSDDQELDRSLQKKLDEGLAPLPMGSQASDESSSVSGLQQKDPVANVATN